MQLRVKVCPMGWSWAVALVVQAGHEHLLRNAGPTNEWVRDRAPKSTPLCASGTLKVLHIDNFAVVATSREEASGLVDEMEAIFSERGIKVACDAEAKREGTL